MSEDTLTPRNETIPGLVELVTLNVGDEFQAGDTGGTVVWKVNKGSARAVDVLYDGHSKPISIAPSLKVMVRKLAEEAEELQLVNTVVCQDCWERVNVCDGVLCADCGEQYCIDCVSTAQRIGGEVYVCQECYHPDMGQTTVLDFESVPESVCMVTQDPKVIQLLPIEDAHESLLSLRELYDGKSPEQHEREAYYDKIAPPPMEGALKLNAELEALAVVEPPAPEDLPPAPKPIPSPTIRVIRLTADGPKTMPVMVQPPLPTCKFDLTLNAEQIQLLVFDSVKQMFYKGLYFGWTRETFFEVAKAKFPHLKAGQNYESCLAQIRLYHCSLKNAGRML